METAKLFQEAQDSDIPIMYLSIPENGSMCLQTDRRCYIGMDYSVLKDEAIKRVHLAHELGHCKTGAFYNRWAACDVRQKHEHRADKWAIEEMIPVCVLDKAIADGHTEMWDLADYFHVTDPFMRKAVCCYRYWNFASKFYF